MIALDLFAGTGWGVACQRLGITEYGVEIMPEAQAVREANGMSTIYSDVWNGLTPGRVEAEAIAGAYDLLIASPPCQTFSMAGGGTGRRALDEVLGLIESKAYRDVAKLREFGERHDPRTALVLTPLAHVYQDTPTFVAFEQVPQVLPVWDRCAEEMRAWGYSVWVGVLNAEQYGVPQTRKRALLIARADGIEAAPPTPTHSRYYSHAPHRLDEGVAPWVSMAEALGWDASEHLVGNQVLPGNARDDYHSRKASAPAQGITSNAGSMQRTPDGRRVMRSNWRRPSYTVTGGGTATGGAEPFGRRAREAMPDGAERVTAAEAAALQSYPSDFTWSVDVPDAKTGKLKPITKTKQFLQIGNAVPPLLAEAILKGFTS